MSKQIPLSGKNGAGKYTIVDDEDYERSLCVKWNLNPEGYVTRSTPRKNGKQSTIGIHRFITNAPSGYLIDHINGDRLDNRKSNLRLCTRRENARNAGAQKRTSSNYKGVSWDKHRNKWRVQIRTYEKQLYIGIFADKIEAAHAYDAAALKYHGEFARTNFN